MNTSSESNYKTLQINTNLYDSARAYVDYGYTVVPTSAKKPLITRWHHQHHSTQDEAFLNEYFTGKASEVSLLCGPASGGLCCIDCDSEDARTDFLTRFPHLAKTRYERSPRGHHYYVSVPSNLHPLMSAYHAPALDIIWQGYVVAAPSEGYTLIEDCMPLEINLDDIANILSWVNERKAQATSTSRVGRYNTIDTTDRPTTRTDLSRLRTLFDSYTKRHESRNIGLFFASTWARDHHMRSETVTNELYDLFVQHVPLADTGKTETERQRGDEFHRTLASAYSQPPRPSLSDFQLTDHLREQLAQAGFINVWRLLDTLYTQGMRPGQHITRAQALEMCRGIVGRDSIYAALEAINEDGRRLFEKFTEKRPPQTPPKNNYVAIDSVDTKEDNPCVTVGVSKSVKTQTKPQNGRPEYTYIIPSLSDIRSFLGLKGKYKAVSYLSLEDLSKSRTARERLHECLILRRAGMYHRQWLAARLGVSVTTIRRYDKARGVNVVSQYTERPMNIENYGKLLEIVRHPGFFLMDSKGKKYPAHFDIAERLIMDGKKVSLWQQHRNYYEIVPPAAPRKLPTRTLTPHPRRPLPFTPLIEPYDTTPAPRPPHPIERASKRGDADTLPPSLNDMVPRLPTHIYKAEKIDSRHNHAWLNKYSPLDEHSGFITGKYKASPTDERNALVSAEIDAIQELIPELSRANTRRLLDNYGYTELRTVAEIVSERHNVRNPAGLAISILKSRANSPRIRQQLKALGF